MSTLVSKEDARQIVNKLSDMAIPPGLLAHLINVGTDEILDTIEKRYFRDALGNGAGTFKYLEGYYGAGKTQLILSLVQRANENKIVSAVATIGKECPFSSPLAIFREIMRSFVAPSNAADPATIDKGIDKLFQHWIKSRIRQLGVPDESEVPDPIRRQLERQLGELWIGAPDTQMASALSAMGRRLIAITCGADPTILDGELIAWVRGEAVRSSGLKKEYGLHEIARDDNAFRRLKTAIQFLRSRLGYRGFFIAFDEGTRTNAFRRGSTQQRQAIENMLTMINENQDGQFGGVMFVYAATPDFRNDVVQKYQALQDRIGDARFSAGSPMVPLIELDRYNSDEVTFQLGQKLLEMFGLAYDKTWDQPLQQESLRVLVAAIKDKEAYLKVPPRQFVYHYCRFLESQRQKERAIDRQAAISFLESNQQAPADDDE
jgi:hypothetical protein